LWQARIQFRDRLRSNRNLAAQYAELKRNLAKEYAEDREAYTQKKWPFIKQVLAK